MPNLLSSTTYHLTPRFFTKFYHIYIYIYIYIFICICISLFVITICFHTFFLVFSHFVFANIFFTNCFYKFIFTIFFSSQFCLLLSVDHQSTLPTPRGVRLRRLPRPLSPPPPPPPTPSRPKRHEATCTRSVKNYRSAY